MIEYKFHILKGGNYIGLSLTNFGVVPWGLEKNVGYINIKSLKPWQVLIKIIKEYLYKNNIEYAYEPSIRNRLYTLNFIVELEKSDFMQTIQMLKQHFKILQKYYF